ncbi:hypothetical protein BC938DRAFT_476143 [Jimgerdemannia flammicorona]|uniref:Uncharacterized protein n=1 Tax=Jimgerdemannia flammicorona TaxID=994334 RepID=A0A433QQU0_9FUNG|nr:hypothetical protein BC938DRAFT_476143 [Jimgerdemannia flammicorona]
MINDIGLKDLDPHFLRQLFGILINLDIEAKHDCELLCLLEHDSCAHDILLVDGPNELEQGLEGTKGRGLDAHAAAGAVDGGHEVGEVGHDFVLEVVLIVVGAHDEETGPGDSLFEVLRSDLDAEGSFDRFVMNVGGLK